MELPGQGCWVYILRCRDGSLYTGWSSCLEKRVLAHNAGRGAKYTKSRRPVELVYFACCETKQAAMRREAQIKRLPRRKKLELIQEHPAAQADSRKTPAFPK